MLTHKEMTAHIRKRIKAAGIKARVRLYTACGMRYIQVFTPTYESRFTADEIANSAYDGITKIYETQPFA